MSWCIVLKRRSEETDFGLQRLFDIANNAREALRVLNVEVDDMDDVFVHNVLRCFDKETKKMYNFMVATSKMPKRSFKKTWEQLHDYVQMQVQANQAT